jgi:hypothetical protein
MQLPHTMISVEKAAEIIGVTTGRVRQLLRGGLLVGQKFSPRTWVVDERSAQKVRKTQHSVGRPRSRQNNF